MVFDASEMCKVNLQLESFKDAKELFGIKATKYKGFQFEFYAWLVFHLDVSIIEEHLRWWVFFILLFFILDKNLISYKFELLT